MSMTIPVLTPLTAGNVAQLADLQNMTSACTFLMSKPIARVHTATAGQVLTASAVTIITFDTLDFDTDGMWSSGTPTRLTIQTPGWYMVRYGIAENYITGNSIAQSVTGPGNPAGSGITTSWWAGYINGHNPYVNMLGGAGVIGNYLYAGDYVQVGFDGNAASSVMNAPIGPYLSLELVSI